MIKVTGFFYIHPLVPVLFLLSYFAGGFHTMLLSYGVVSVHELFHLFAALFSGERVGSVIVMPFGMTLRLSAGHIRHPGKERFIALAGPFANVLMLFCAKGIQNFYPEMPLSLSLFQVVNWSVLCLNLLPCLPLDGGRALKALLTRQLGYLSAVSITRRISRYVTLLLFLLCILLLCVSRMNISLLMVASFLTVHMAAEGRQNDYVIMQELLYAKEKLRKKGVMKSCCISATALFPARKILKQISHDRYFLVHIVDENERFLRTVTEAQLVSALINQGFLISLADIET